MCVVACLVSQLSQDIDSVVNSVTSKGPKEKPSTTFYTRITLTTLCELCVFCFMLNSERFRNPFTGPKLWQYCVMNGTERQIPHKGNRCFFKLYFISFCFVCDFYVKFITILSEENNEIVKYMKKFNLCTKYFLISNMGYQPSKLVHFNSCSKTVGS